MLLNCKECGKQVSTQAKRCPNCGAKSPKKPVPKLALIASLIFWALIIYACSTLPNRVLTPAEKVEKVIRNVAYTCSYSVKELLNDPDSAKFDYDHIDATPEIRKHDAAWIVRIPVRAKNAFNATILAIYQCRVKKTGDDNWEVLSVRQIT